MEKSTLVITGMSCAACSARIDKKLHAMEGITEANVNLATGKATVSFDPSLINLIMTETLRQRYIDAGLTHEQIDQVVEWSYYVTYAILGVVTLFYQGGMALYYFRRRDAVA